MNTLNPKTTVKNLGGGGYVNPRPSILFRIGFMSIPRRTNQVIKIDKTHSQDGKFDLRKYDIEELLTNGMAN